MTARQLRLQLLQAIEGPAVIALGPRLAKAPAHEREAHGAGNDFVVGGETPIR